MANRMKSSSRRTPDHLDKDMIAMRTVLVTNLDNRIDSNTLVNIFSAYGLVLSTSIDPIYRSEARIVFHTEEEAINAVNNGNYMRIGSKYVTVQRMVSKKSSGPYVRDNWSQTVKSQYECGICFEKRLNNDLFDCGCGHQFCAHCMQHYLETKISDGTVSGLKCPRPECQRVVDQSLVKRLVTPEVFDRYVTIELKMATKDMPEIMNCPNPRCSALIEAELHHMLAYCVQCDHAYCTNCLREYHGMEIECQPSHDQKQNQESEQWKERVCKKCPKCRAPIEKIEGCDHMTCAKCGHQFCWLCLNDWSLIHHCVPNSVRNFPQWQTFDDGSEESDDSGHNEGVEDFSEEHDQEEEEEQDEESEGYDEEEEEEDIPDEEESNAENEEDEDEQEEEEVSDEETDDDDDDTDEDDSDEDDGGDQ